VQYSESITSKYEMIHQGLSAERIADQWGFSRKQMDELSYESHQRAIAARKEGKFTKEIMPIEITLENGSTKIISEDEGPREDTSIEVLNGLNPVFKEDGKITAGNSSQISDGASAILMMSREKAEQLGLKPKFLVHTRVVVGSDPTL